MLTRMSSLQPVLSIIIATALFIGCSQSGDRQQSPTRSRGRRKRPVKRSIRTTCH
jgi:hypothetical protein